MSDVPELQVRWTMELLQQSNVAIARQAKTKHILAPSPFGKTPEGKADYRAFTLLEAVKYATFDNADFTGSACDWAGSLSYCTVKRSLFTGGTFDGRFVTTSFSECDFADSSLKDARLGERFCDTSFVRSNLTKAIASQASFVHCDFTGANFARAMFTRCEFVDCTLTGAKFHNATLAESSFTRCVIDEHSFDRAITDNVKRLD
jgi:fluoroquinolone resistance protein